MYWDILSQAITLLYSLSHYPMVTVQATGPFFTSPAIVGRKAILLFREFTKPHTRVPLNYLLALGGGGVQPTSWHLPKLFLGCSAESQLPPLISFLFIQTHGSPSLCCWDLAGRGLRAPIPKAFCDCSPPAQPHLPSLTEYEMGKWLITALTRFTMQGLLWVSPSKILHSPVFPNGYSHSSCALLVLGQLYQ